MCYNSDRKIKGGYMKDRKNLKGLLFLALGLIGLITTLIVNNSVENDLLCIILMFIFLVLEIYGLSRIIKNKYEFR